MPRIFYTITFIVIFNLLFLSGECRAQGSNSDNTVKFVQISDVHFSDTRESVSGRMFKESAALMTDAVNQVNQLKDIDFVVFTGDMISVPDENLLEKFCKMANKLKPKWHWTTGNHDIGENFSRSEFLQKMNKKSSQKQDKTYYSFQLKNFLFIFMDGSFDDKKTAHGYFTEDELNWLESKLKQNRDLYAVIFQHYPLIEPFKSSTHNVLNKEKYIKLLEKYNNVIAVISGHYHGTGINVIKEVAHISTPALIQTPNAFRAITLKNMGDYVFISYEFKPTGLKDVKQRSFKTTRSPMIHDKEESDRNGVIMLHKPLHKNRGFWIFDRK